MGRHEQYKDRLRIMKSNNTAVVEKIWKIDTRDFKFDPDKFDYALVRPCDVPYRTYKNFLTCKHPKCKMITHEGAVMSWHRDKSNSFSSEPKTFEEMIVNAGFNKQTSPDFENWLFDLNWKTYTVKTIDLRTGKVLYDCVDKWLSESRARNLI